ncbi:MAG TPA: hypothetical protein VMA83_07065 [Solirubrobacteraceae bacterium]|nr:hypothetical protein [Solirubrobacteraceae bacterium]
MESPSTQGAAPVDGGGAPPRRGGPRVIFAALAVVAVVAAIVALAVHHSAPNGGGGAATKAERHPPAVRLPACGAECAPIDAAYQTDLRFGNTSPWIQPWRAYLDTWPASRLLEAIGVNFNITPNEADATARLLHESGFRLARIGLAWGSISYSEPSHFVDEASIRTRFLALKRWHLRPLILLDANSESPAPHIKVTLQTTAPAAVGATTIKLTPASASQVVAGKTGLDAGNFNSGFVLHRAQRRLLRKMTPQQRRERHERLKAEKRRLGLSQLTLTGNPAILITHVSADGVATLSRPLPRELPAGAHKAATLRYAPFQAQRLANGQPNPVFKETMNGWLAYVRTVSRLASSIFGSGGFDLEVWNELSFGSQFLDAAKYYATPPAGEGKHATKMTAKALLAATVAWVRSSASGLSPAVGVSNGFADETPFAGGAHAPVGLTAISKHPYAGPKEYPAQYRVRPGHIPLNAIGERDTEGPRNSSGAYTPRFIPHMRVLFPEYYLTAETPDTLIRDLSPIKTYIYSAPHGRNVHRAGQPPLQVWVTEYNLGSKRPPATGPDGYTPLPHATFTMRDREHFESKVLTRSLVAMVGKGVRREYFFAAAHAGDLSLIPESFVESAAHGGYPGTGAGGAVMATFRNLVAQFAGPGPGAGARQLKLVSITQQGDHAQFTGDGSAEHPSLLDREVLFVQPFQSSPARFVIPFYVMTRNLKTDYDPSAPASDLARYDLPNETFRVTLSGLPAGTPTVTAYDPITGSRTPAALVDHSGSTATFEIAATDYPRLLELQYR